MGLPAGGAGAPRGLAPHLTAPVQLSSCRPRLAVAALTYLVSRPACVPLPPSFRGGVTSLLLTPVPCGALNSAGFDTPGGAGLQKSCSSTRSAAGLLLLAAGPLSVRRADDAFSLSF